MNLPAWVWLATIAGFALVLAFDFWLVARNPHEPSFRECVGWVVFYVGLAAAFGVGLWILWGGDHGGGVLRRMDHRILLSVDNLFVFLIIMSRFQVPRQYRQKVLLIGIIIALVMRGAFIAAGAGCDLPVRLALLYLRRLPDLHRVEAHRPRGRRGRVLREHRPAHGPPAPPSTDKYQGAG